MGTRPVVMVVEDDEEMNQLQRDFLDLYGLDTIGVYDGAEAVRLCCESEPAGVLLDLMLPKMDGLETCRQLRQKVTNHRRMPIVIVTALDSEEFRRQGFEAGADAYFAKPFDPDEVARTIQLLVKATGPDGE